MQVMSYSPRRSIIPRLARRITQYTRRENKRVHVGNMGAYLYIQGMYVYMIPNDSLDAWTGDLVSICDSIWGSLANFVHEELFWFFYDT